MKAGRGRARAAAVLVGLFLLCAGAARAAEWIDAGFAGGGYVRTEVLPDFDGRVAPNIWDLAPEGRNTLGALADLTEHQNYFGLVRFRGNGNLDTRFGEGGFTAPLGDWPDKAQSEAVLVAPDGRIVVAGYRHRSLPAPLLAAYRRNGSLDRSFGTDGVVAPAYGGRGEALHDLSFQSSGRLIAVGAGGEHGIGLSGRNPSGFVVAYKPDGRVDRSFGHNGRVEFPARSERWEYTGLKTVEVLPDNRILAAGFRRGSLFLVRLLRDGGLDRSFGGGDGQVTMFLGNRRSVCSETCWRAAPFAVRRDGRIVVAAADGPDWPVVVQLHPDGSRDFGFGRDGMIRVGPIRDHYLQPFDLALAGNRILLGGFDENDEDGTILSFTVFAYLQSGKLDRSFGRRGIDNRHEGPYSGAFSFLELPEGRTVVGGGGQDKAEGDRWYSSYLLLSRYVSD